MLPDRFLQPFVREDVVHQPLYLVVPVSFLDLGEVDDQLLDGQREEEFLVITHLVLLLQVQEVLGYLGDSLWLLEHRREVQLLHFLEDLLELFPQVLPFGLSHLSEDVLDHALHCYLMSVLLGGEHEVVAGTLIDQVVYLLVGEDGGEEGLDWD